MQFARPLDGPHSLGLQHADQAILAILKNALQMATDNYPEVNGRRRSWAQMKLGADEAGRR